MIDLYVIELLFIFLTFLHVCSLFISNVHVHKNIQMFGLDETSPYIREGVRSHGDGQCCQETVMPLPDHGAFDALLKLLESFDTQTAAMSVPLACSLGIGSCRTTILSGCLTVDIRDVHSIGIG